MSAPNPSIRTCALCDRPPLRDFPHYPLCLHHNAPGSEKEAAKLGHACATVEATSDPDVLATLADAQDEGGFTEFNFPANIIMATEIHAALMDRKNIAVVRAEAEQMMLQIAFANDGLNPPCSFIGAAYRGGWRYRIDKGFHKVPA